MSILEKSSLDFLMDLLHCGTPSGFEGHGQRRWLDYVKQFPVVSSNVGCDSLGNCWASTKTVPRPFVEGTLPEIMVVGHCDEIGLMITDASDKGYLSFAPVGGVDIGVLQGSRVLFHDPNGLGRRILGVIGRQPIHLQDDEEDKKKVKFRDLWIDIGADSKKQALSLVPVGTVAYIEREPACLLNDLITCRGIDDKVGAFVSAESVRLGIGDIGYTVTGVSTVQEEIGLCGSVVIAERIRPTAAIVVDVGFASDTPDEDDSKTVGDVKVGNGPMLHVGAAINQKVNKCLMEAAEQVGVKIQIVPEPNTTGTDADAVRLASVGIPTANVSIPVRYMHTPAEVCSLRDVWDAVRLISAACAFIAKVDTFDPWTP